MALTIKKVDYYYTSISDQPGSAYSLLSRLAAGEVNLLAFNAVPFGPNRTQLTLFPEDADALLRVLNKEGLNFEGPHSALLVRGDDELGALADIHVRLYDAQVNVFSSSGVTDGRGGFGYVLHVRPEKFERAAAALGL